MKLIIPTVIACAVSLSSAGQNPQRDWPDFVREISITSSADGSNQPAMFYAPPGDDPVPLLVSLHTWGGTYRQLAAGRARWCQNQQWMFIHPHFRGPNNQPEAMGSDLAVQDILDAVTYAAAQRVVDTNRIYILGFSGGGHAAMLMAGRAPDIWAGVSAWCGISDLKKWHAQNAGYGRAIAAAVRGNPQEDEAAAAECARRSPITWLENARHIAVDIAAGIHDGHTGSVPISQSLEAFNALALPRDRLSAEDIDYMTRQRAIPEHLRGERGAGQMGRREIHFQRQSGNVRITIFEGGHSGVDSVALPWLAMQRKGEAAIWKQDQPDQTAADEDEAAIGR